MPKIGVPFAYKLLYVDGHGLTSNPYLMDVDSSQLSVDRGLQGMLMIYNVCTPIQSSCPLSFHATLNWILLKYISSADP